MRTGGAWGGLLLLALGAGPASASPVPPVQPAVLVAPPPVQVGPDPEAPVAWVQPVPELRRVVVGLHWDQGRRQLCPRRPVRCAALERLLPRATADRDGAALAEQLDLLGAEVSLWIGPDTAELLLDVPADGLDEGLALLAALRDRPALARWDLRAHRRAGRAALGPTMAEDPAQLRDHVYAQHWAPAEAPAVARRAAWWGPSRGALRRLQRRLAARPAALVAGGATSLPALVSAAEAAGLLADTPPSRPPPPRPAAARRGPPGPRVVAVDVPDTGAPVWICVGVGAAAVDGGTAPALLESVLWAPSTGRVDAELRERRGWTYGTEAGHHLEGDQLRHWMQLQVPAAAAAPAVGAVSAALAALAAGGPRPEEAAAAAAALRASANRQRGTAAGAHQQAWEQWRLHRSSADDHAARAQVLAAPAASIQAAAARWHQPDSPVLWIVVGPRAALEAPLATLPLPVSWWHWRRGGLRPQRR